MRAKICSVARFGFEGDMDISVRNRTEMTGQILPHRSRAGLFQRPQYRADRHGITLLETVLYIGLFAVILLSATTFFLEFGQSRELFARRAQMEQSSGVILAYLNTELTGADAWNVSASTLGSVNGSLVYTNDDGVSVTIDRPTEVVTFDGTPQSVNRLRVTVSEQPAEWVTPPDINVVAFELSEVTDGLGATTGLNLTLELFMLNPSGSALRAAFFSSQTTFALHPATIVL